MNKIIDEFGGRRVWFQDYRDLYIRERTVKIRWQYTGAMLRDLACGGI